MNKQMANLSDEQHKQINDLERQLGVVLIAYDGYTPEDEKGNPLQKQ